MSRSAFRFASKADTLAALAAWPELAIPPLMAFTTREWQADRANILARIQGLFPGPVAVRSSCRREDNASQSQAGAYLSRLDIDPNMPEALARAIDAVIASYGTAAPEDQVLIQAMIKNPQVTGVIMTRVLADGAPYYTISYDDESGRTDTVTGGLPGGKTVYVHREARDADFDSPRLAAFVGLAKKCEEICASDALDIEFCLDQENGLHLLQARPISARRRWRTGPDSTRIELVAEFVAAKTGRCPGLFGRRSILGVMPDWNPAEMIGVFPRPLAASLYRSLITARVWARARENMGYRRLPRIELMPLIFGRPYIDVRASLNSFLPQELDGVTCEVLVDAWLERLDANPQLHDKIEFDIAQTSLDFCFDANLDSWYPGLLTLASRDNFRRQLRNLTNACLDLSPRGTLTRALDAIAELKGRQGARPRIDGQNRGSLADLGQLVGECRKFGTLPFAILARHAFIAESLLRSAARRGALSPRRVAEFKMSIRTVSREMAAEFHAVCAGGGNARAFMRKYGHLRPGSYDILSPRYADRREIFAASPNSAPPEESAPFRLSPQEHRELAALLAEHGLTAAPADLLVYAQKAIAGREYAKFIFSRNLSDILEIIAFFGEDKGFSRDEISHVGLQDFLAWATSAWPESAREYFGRRIAGARELGLRASHLKLGYLIRSARDVYIAPQHRAAPNFVGKGRICAPATSLSAASSCEEDIAGKIVCIENADPGFDWIFTRNIAGLVTRFGGANSHMAIRCAEYGLPAAIGVGERLYVLASGAQKLILEPDAAILKAG